MTSRRANIMSIVFIMVFLCPAESLGGSDVLSIALFLEYNHSLTHEKKYMVLKKDNWQWYTGFGSEALHVMIHGWG